MLDQIPLGEYTKTRYSADEMWMERTMSGGESLALASIASAFVAAGNYADAEHLAMGNTRVQAKVAFDMLLAGELERARKLTERALAAVKVMDVDDFDDRFKAAAILVEILPRLGNVEAAIDLIKIDVNIEDLVDFEEDWSDAIYRLAWTLAELGESESAQQVIDYFLRVQKKIEDEEESDLDWESTEKLDATRLAPAWARMGKLDQAWQMAQDDIWARHQVIETAMQVNQFEWARRQAENIPNRTERVRALLAITQILSTQSDITSAKQVLNRAWEETGLIEDRLERGQALSSVARGFALLNEQGAVRQALNQVLPLIEGVGSDENRSIRGLLQLAEALATIPAPDIARQVLEHICHIVQRLTSERQQVNFLCEAAEAWARLGNNKEARRALENATSVAERLKQRKESAEVLFRVAELLAKVDAMPEAHRVLDAALQRMDDKPTQAEELCRLAELLIQLGDRPRATSLIRDAVTLAKEQVGNYGFGKIQDRLIALLCQVGDLEQAIQLATTESDWSSTSAVRKVMETLLETRGVHEALTEVQQLSGSVRLHSMLLELAQTYIDRGDLGAAQQILDAAFAESKQITPAVERVRFLVQVAEALNKSDAPEKAQEVWKSARRTAQHVKDRWNRVEALIQAHGYEQAMAGAGKHDRGSNRRG